MYSDTKIITCYIYLIAVSVFVVLQLPEHARNAITDFPVYSSLKDMNFNTVRTRMCVFLAYLVIIFIVICKSLSVLNITWINSSPYRSNVLLENRVTEQICPVSLWRSHQDCNSAFEACLCRWTDFEALRNPCTCKKYMLCDVIFFFLRSWSDWCL